MKTYTKQVTTTEPKLIIEYEDDPMSPREDTNLGYFVFISSNFNSPDYHPTINRIVESSGDRAENQKRHMEMIKIDIESALDEKVIAIFPITMYEHSGISYSLGNQKGFDYSNGGFYIITEESRKEYGVRKDKRAYKKFIEAELKIYNQYINGDILRFTLFDNDGEVEDSCGGFYDIESIKEELPKEWKDEDMNDYLL